MFPLFLNERKGMTTVLSRPRLSVIQVPIVIHGSFETSTHLSPDWLSWHGSWKRRAVARRVARGIQGGRPSHLEASRRPDVTSRHVTSRHVTLRRVTRVSDTHTPSWCFLFTTLVVFCSLAFSQPRRWRNARTRSQALLKALSARLKLSSSNLSSVNSSHSLGRIFRRQTFKHNDRHVKSSTSNEGTRRYLPVYFLLGKSRFTRMLYTPVFPDEIETRNMEYPAKCANRGIDPRTNYLDPMWNKRDFSTLQEKFDF